MARPLPRDYKIKAREKAEALDRNDTSIFPIDLTIDTLYKVSIHETYDQNLKRNHKYMIEYNTLMQIEREKERLRTFESPVESSEELTKKMKEQWNTSLDELMINAKHKITDNDIIYVKNLEKALFKFNPTLIYSDLNYLKLERGGPPKTMGPYQWSNYYKHSKRELYLEETTSVSGQHKWRDVTNDYQWDQIFLNKSTRFETFKIKKKSLIDIIC